MVRNGDERAFGQEEVARNVLPLELQPGSGNPHWGWQMIGFAQSEGSNTVRFSKSSYRKPLQRCEGDETTGR